MGLPKVSIIIPAYNAENFLKRSVGSVLQQSLDDWELIIIDDGSTDNTYQIASSYSQRDNRIKVFTKENEGQGIARNLGIEHASGEYIGFMDADDYIQEEMLFDLTSAADNYKADMAYSYMHGDKIYYRISEDDNNLGIQVFDTKNKVDLFKKNMMGCLPNENGDSNLGISVCRSLFRKELLDKYKIRFVSERIVHSEDLLFNLDYIMHCSKIVTVENEYYMYCHDNPKSFSLKLDNRRYYMYKKLNDEVVARCRDEDDLLRASRRFLSNVRITIVEKSRWCTFSNYLDIRKSIFEILNDSYLLNELNLYPINQLPAKHALYYNLMKKKFILLLIMIAKIRYRR